MTHSSKMADNLLGLPMTKKAFLQALLSYIPYDAQEEEYRQRFINLIRTQQRPFNRYASPEHFTASAFVVNKAITHTLLIHHKKLNAWINPGGHCDDNESVHETALLETFEETGLRNISAAVGLLDLHCYDYIKTKDPKERDADFDTAILVFADMNETVTLADREVGGYKWVEIDDLLSIRDKSSFRRIVTKVQAIRQAPKTRVVKIHSLKFTSP